MPLSRDSDSSKWLQSPAAALYARQSGSEPEGIRRQIEACQQLAEAHHHLACLSAEVVPVCALFTSAPAVANGERVETSRGLSQLPVRVTQA